MDYYLAQPVKRGYSLRIALPIKTILASIILCLSFAGASALETSPPKSATPVTISAADLKSNVGKKVSVTGRYNRLGEIAPDDFHSCIEVDGPEYQPIFFDVRDVPADGVVTVTGNYNSRENIQINSNGQKEWNKIFVHRISKINRLIQNHKSRIQATGVLGYLQSKGAETKAKDHYFFCIDNVKITPDEFGERPDIKKLVRTTEGRCGSVEYAWRHQDYARAAKIGETILDSWKKVENSPFRQDQICTAIRRNIRNYERLNDWAKVENLYRDLIDYSVGTHSVPKTFYLFRIADACTRQQKFREAEAAYRACLQIPDTRALASSQQESIALILARLISSIESQGRIEDAELELKQELTKSETNVEPIITRQLRNTYRTFLKKRHRDAEAQLIADKLEDNHCPICHQNGNNIQKIAYGLLMGRPKPGWIAGGCVVSDASPWFYCSVDKIRF